MAEHPASPERHAVITEALRDGRSWDHVRRQLAERELVRAWRGAYLPSSLATRAADRLDALQASVDYRVIACVHTGALLQGTGVIDDGLLHITTLDGHSVRPRRGLVVHQAPPRSDPVLVGGVWTTDPADTTIDVACCVPEIDILAVLDAAMRADQTPELLELALARAQGRRGLAKVRDWLPYADWRAESPMESRTRYRMLAAGLPAPDLQVAVRLPDGSIRYLDHGWQDYRVGADFDGREAHLGHGERDRERHNGVTDEGWRMYYPTGVTVYRGHHGFIQMIAKALRERGYRGPIGRRVSPLTVPRPAPGPASRYLAQPRYTWSASRQTPR